MARYKVEIEFDCGDDFSKQLISGFVKVELKDYLAMSRIFIDNIKCRTKKL